MVTQLGLGALPGPEGICVHTQRKATPYSAGEGLGPIQSRKIEDLVGVHPSDNRRRLGVHNELIIGFTPPINGR